jgi:FixJ family two-component response regulator
MQPCESNEIAVLEPNHETRAWLARILRDSGYRPLLFESELEFFREQNIRRAGCLIADDSLPVLNCVQVQMLLSRLSYRLPAIFLSSVPTIEKTVKVMRAGATDFLPKPVTTEVLLNAVAVAMALNGQNRERQQRREIALARFGELTPRELEVLKHVVAGRRNKQTAAELGIVEKTIKVHRARAMQKVGVRTLPDLVQLVDTAGVLSGETAADSFFALWDWDMVEDRVTGNRALATLFHMEDAPLDGVPIQAFIENVHAEDALALRVAIDQATAAHTSFQARYRVCDTSGRARMVLACGRVIYNVAGNPVRFPGIAVSVIGAGTRLP